jgi:cytochrome P450
VTRSRESGPGGTGERSLGTEPGWTPAISAAVTADLADPALYGAGDPVHVWRELRAAAPVYWNERPGSDGFWALTRYQDVVAVYKDTRTFTSECGMRLDLNQAASDAAATKMLIVTDPPRHHQIRRVIGSAFTPRMARRLERNMRHTVTESLDGVLAAGTVDFTDVAAKLPVSVICDMLGVPRSDWDFMLDRTRTAFGERGATSNPFDRVLAAAEAHADLLLYYADLVAYRRREPGDDIVTAMVLGDIDGLPLTDEEIFLNCDGLISGGNETTRHASVAGLLALIRHPDWWARLRAEPELLDTAVQEVLRYTSPALHVLRTAVTDAVIGGRHIGAGDRVALWNAAANRDGAVFADPDTLDLARTPNQHVAFGAGAHHCLGAALATLELRVLFGELARRVDRVELAGPVRRLHSNLIWGIASMPVTLREG